MSRAEVDVDDVSPRSSSGSVAWSCENDEIDKLIAFLQQDAVSTGRYRLVREGSESAHLLDALSMASIDATSVVSALTSRPDIGEIVAALATTGRGAAGAQQAVLERRRTLVARLRELVGNPASTETDVQKMIDSEHWLFGGRYVGVASRRNLTMLDQHDIPLLGADGTLHVVELKGPSIQKLIVRYRNHWIVGPAVHEAAAQAANYLRDLDEQGLNAAGVLANELGQVYDMSRCFATVVIGHSDHHRPRGVERRVVGRTLRQYSATLNRIEVLSYDQLIDSAERALSFEVDVNRLDVESPEG